MLTRPSVQLGEIADFVMGQAPPGNECNVEGNGTIFVKAGEFGPQYPEVREWTTKPLKLAKSGDALVCVVGATAGKVNRAIDCAIGRSVAAVRPRADKLDGGYLFRFLSSETLSLRQQSQGLAQGVITRDMLGELLIPLPSLAEQRRIAAILDEADALRAKRRAALAQLDEMARATFLEMFGDPATNPKGWPMRYLGELVEVRGGKRLPKGDTYSEVPTPYRYIRVSDLNDGKIDESKLVFLRPDTQRQIARYTVDTGDIIISIAGSIGEIACVPRSVAGANLTENAAKLVARRADDYRPEFLAAYLQTEFAQEQIGARVGQVTIGKLALFRIEQLSVMLPNLAAQSLYLERMQAIETLHSDAVRSVSSLDDLFASLQKRAFRGEL